MRHGTSIDELEPYCCGVTTLLGIQILPLQIPGTETPKKVNCIDNIKVYVYILGQLVPRKGSMGPKTVRMDGTTYRHNIRQLSFEDFYLSFSGPPLTLIRIPDPSALYIHLHHISDSLIHFFQAILGFYCIETILSHLTH